MPYFFLAQFFSQFGLCQNEIIFQELGISCLLEFKQLQDALFFLTWTNYCCFQDWAEQVEISDAIEVEEVGPFQHEQVLDTPIDIPVKRTKCSSHADNETKTLIVQQCVEGKVSPQKLEQVYHYSQKSVRGWVKKEGHQLPAKYNKNETPNHVEHVLVDPKV